MSTPIGVVFCIDDMSSMEPDSGRIRENIASIADATLANHQNGSCVSLVKSRSHNDHPVTSVHGFTEDRNMFAQWLYSQQPGEGGGVNGYKAVGEALREVLNLQWRVNDNDEIFREKLVILMTDGAPNGLFSTRAGKDPWVMSNLLRGQGITLVVVGVGPCIVDCDDFYCALAKNTGGAYIPLGNAQRVLSRVIELATVNGIKFYRAFDHIMMEYIERNSSFEYSNDMKIRVDGMINECRTMADIRNRFYNHRRSN